MYYLNCFVQNYLKHDACWVWKVFLMEHTVLATVSIFVCVCVFFVLKLLQELDGLIEDHFGTISVTNSILKKRTGNQLTFDLMMMKYKTKKS